MMINVSYGDAMAKAREVSIESHDCLGEQGERYAGEVYPYSVAGKCRAMPLQSALAWKCFRINRIQNILHETFRKVAYARNPKFYGATFCCQCRDHYPVGEKGEFEWLDGSKVGS